MNIPNILSNLPFLGGNPKVAPVPPVVPTPVQGPITTKDIPNARQSRPEFYHSITGVAYPFQMEDFNMSYIRKVIPLIRNLIKFNPDMGQALHNVVTLANTGHKVVFDKGVSQELQDKMRNHLTNKKREWSGGTAGMDGLINKMLSQQMITGALSTEWVPNNQLNSIEACVLVNPEDIYFRLDDRRTGFFPYQLVKNGLIIQEKGTPTNSADPIILNMVALNPKTYKYFALNGDEEKPYGYPPYMTAMEGIKRQYHMNKNIDYIVSQLGLLGFMEVLLATPTQLDNENDTAYTQRLQTHLSTVAQKFKEGVRDGAVVGYKDEHEFEFHSVTKEFSGANELFQENELQIASGLKQDASLLGRAYTTSESFMGIVFTKLLSELRNIQSNLIANLEFGYTLELKLQGFKFDYLKVVFNKSTIQDDLKSQQALEIKIRNLNALYWDGIVDLNEYAQELGYEEPSQQTPRAPRSVTAIFGPDGEIIPLNGAPPEEDNSQTGAVKKKDREDKKNKSDRTKRDRNKPQGTHPAGSKKLNQQEND